MTIRHLNIFVAVADYGSMSAAATHLYLSQPTVSQAIRELENNYNSFACLTPGEKTVSYRTGGTSSAESKRTGPPV